jgi:glucosamine-6-phosphate deaminase
VKVRQDKRSRGAVSARWPCTALQLHPNVLVVLDEAAAGGLELVDYHREGAEQRASAGSGRTR